MTRTIRPVEVDGTRYTNPVEARLHRAILNGPRANRFHNPMTVDVPPVEWYSPAGLRLHAAHVNRLRRGAEVR